ncbi:MAG TPA: ABC transporter ATP-binding protein [Candidatus Angelobacter sp.]|nr:ABC transporter ATP-binding protein [Candidatus Angelobacter sp.]
MSEHYSTGRKSLLTLAAELALVHKCTLIVGTASAVFLVICHMSMPWLLGILIDRGILARSGHALIMTCLALAASSCGVAVFGALQRQAFKRLASSCNVELRVRMAKQMRRLPLAYFHGERIGHISSLFTNEAPTYCMLFDSVLGELILDGLRIACTLAFLFFIYHWKALLCLLSVPFYIAFSVPMNKRVLAHVLDLQRATSEMNAVLHESIAATREIKAFGYEPWDIANLQNSFAGLLGPRLKLNLYQEGATLTFLVFWLVAAALYWWGGTAVIAGRMTLGTVTALISYLAMMQDPFARMVGMSGELNAASAAGRAIIEFFAIRPEPQYPTTSSSSIADVADSIRLSDVRFAYGDGKPALENINFKIAHGQKLAIVGPSGAGKSTLVNLIPRFFETADGAIYIDGQLITSIPVPRLRSSIGMVFQDTFLMAGTIYQNIALGNPEASRESVVEAAIAANAHRFISMLPRGYDTEIGERGVTLSAGEKQRIAIARAILRDPKLLILDEATASLDSESEAAVLDALRRLQRGRTTIVIAHRLSSVIDADLVILLIEGRIKAIGTHASLTLQSEEYRQLFGLFAAPEGLASDPSRAPEATNSYPALGRVLA